MLSRLGAVLLLRELFHNSIRVVPYNEASALNICKNFPAFCPAETTVSDSEEAI